jgi:hypothetical protein
VVHELRRVDDPDETVAVEEIDGPIDEVPNGEPRSV